MKARPFIRATPAAAPVSGTEPRLPFRLWMTGSLAVVMAALLPMREVDASERSSLRLLQHSRFDVTETVLRIEAAARGHGLSVLARTAGARPVIVFESKAGGTLVVMDDADSEPAVPMSMLVRAGESGGADVWVASTLAYGTFGWMGLPANVAEDLAALPDWVGQALS